MANTIYFGVFNSYEEYYAIGETAEDVKKLLWKMYCFNCYSKPTKEDRKTFEEEIYIRAIKSGKTFGYNTKFCECYKLSGARLERVKGD